VKGSQPASHRGLNEEQEGDLSSRHRCENQYVATSPYYEHLSILKLKPQELGANRISTTPAKTCHGAPAGTFVTPDSTRPWIDLPFFSSASLAL
jgi:hypothetical protein